MTTRLLAGSGGGGGKGGGGGQQATYTPNEEKDNLDSRQYATVIDLVSEGEIEGLVNGAQSIFLDKTPLQSPDGSYNFKNVTAITRSGTQAQSYIPLDTGIENEVPVGVTVTQATPITRTITTNTVNAARVTINIPALQRFTDKGDRYGSVFRMQIAVQYNGGGYTVVIDDTIRGRTVDLYQRQYLVPLNGAFPVNIRVIRVTNDNAEQDVGGASNNIINAFSWASYTEITYTKFRYPNSALVALRIDAEQFSNIPQRSYLIRGIKVAIPSNATVDSITGRLIYSGIWNGTFGAAAWTTDPAWILWDLLVSTRYGFGDHIKAAALDKFAFYSASVYASAPVSNGLGGTEPRFSCNVNIQTAEDAYKLIGDMCSVFRAMPYWAAGALTVSQDAPSDPAYLFTPANVKDGIFTYSGSSLKNRPTVAIVSYLDLELRDVTKEVVEDAALIAKYGVVTTEISAFACTSRSQARRMGKWLLYSEWYESTILSFTIGLEAGVLVRPGQIISIADPVRAGARRGGRISAATTTTVTADDITGITYAAGATLSVILPTGVTQTRTVSGIAGRVFTVSSAFTVAPNVNSIWIYETSSIQAQLFRVLGIEEQDGIEYTVSAIEHNPSKYAYIEDGAPLAARDITDLNEIPEPPASISATEILYEVRGGVRSKIIISWQERAGINQYRVRWRVANGNWITDTLSRADYEILDASPGLYEIEVYSLNAALQSSISPAQLVLNALGKTAPPQDVTGVSLIPIDQASAILSWDRATDLDVLIGGNVVIRHSQVLSGAVWDESQDIVTAAAGNQTQKQVPLLEGTYMLKFADDGGRRSVNATLIVTNLPTPLNRLLVQEYAEDQETPPFSGIATDMYYDADVDGLILSAAENGYNLLLEDNDDILLEDGGILLLQNAPAFAVLPKGEYDFNLTLDFGGVYDVNVQRRFVTRAFMPANLWDDRILDIDEWTTIDDTNLDRVNAALYVRTTLDSTAGTPTWSVWKEFANAIVRGRGFQFKTIATSSDPAMNIIIDELGCILEMQQRIEQSAVLQSTAGTYSATFPNPFYEQPNIGITGFNMGTGDYFTLSAVTRTGFQVTFRDSAGTAVNRQFTYTAVGYGREII